MCSVSVIAPIVEIVLKIPSRLDGSSERTVIAGSIVARHLATEAPLAAQTAHRAWVMIRSGFSRRMASSSTAKIGRRRAAAAPTRLWIAASVAPRRSTTRAGHDGLADASVG